MINSNTSLVFLLLIFASTSFAQDKAVYDSLLTVYQKLPDDTSKVNTLDQLHQLVLHKDIDQAKKYVEEELALAKKLNFRKGIGSAYYNLGAYFENIGVRDSAMHYFEQSKKIFLELGDLNGSTKANKAIAINEYYRGNPNLALDLVNENIQNRILLKDSSGLASDYNFQGGIYRQLGKIDLALKSVLEAINIYEILQNKIGKADALQVLAALEDGKKSLIYNQEALAIYEEAGDKFYQALVNNNIGTDHIHDKNFEKAAIHLEKAIDLATELNAIDIVGDAKSKMSHVYMNQEDYASAIRSLKDALAIHDKNKQAVARVENLASIAIVYNKMNRPEMALPYINECISLVATINSLEKHMGAYEVRSESLRKLGSYEKALDDFTQFKLLNDSLFNTEKIEQIERLKTEFEVDRQEKELIIEKDKVELLEKEATLSRLQRLLLLLGLGLSIIIAGLGYYGFRQKMQRVQLEKEKLDVELEFKKKKLTTLALQLAQKNERLVSLKSEAQKLRKTENDNRGYQQLINSINLDLNNDSYWQKFSRFFEEVHHGFNSTAIKKYPDLTPNELRLMSLIKMNLSSKEIANMLNISIPGVKKARQRLRKKMNLDTPDSLETAVLKV